MDAKIPHATPVAKDQQAASDSYTKSVGFEKKTDFTPPGDYRWITVGPWGKDPELALFQPGTTDANNWSGQRRPGTRPPIVLRVDDWRRAFGEMNSRGVRFKQPQSEEYAWGLSAMFSDPDDNLLPINQLKAFSSRS
jgi:catechol 2,3-dioxygenase-like lactoylglutathione lyase family enzyme